MKRLTYVMFGLLMLYCALSILFLLVYAVAPPRPSAAVKNGSVIFWRGGLLVKPILKHTGSDITHAAIVLDGFVWEAVPPRVHKVPLAEYIKQMEAQSKHKNFTWFLMQPKKAYTDAESRAMLAYAESQLGRRYQLRGYWKGHEVRGIFCSQLVGDVLKTVGYKSGGVRETPVALYKKIKDTYQ
jgi:hypothetical protein